MIFRQGGPLGTGYSAIFNHYLADQGQAGASEALKRALKSHSSPVGHLFTSNWRPGDESLGAVPEAQALRITQNIARLAEGSAGVVVTGQQPGCGGGPLYTLYKIATAVALAERRTRLGRPTIPVFWSADDDSDLKEALAPLAWDQEDGKFHAGGGKDLLRRRDYRRRMVGTIACSDICRGSSPWLGGKASRRDDVLFADLAELLHSADQDSWSLARLNTAVWYRCFRASDLLIISGNDSNLYEAAAPWTSLLRDRTPVLIEMAREQGQLLIDSQWHAQLKERSLRTPWYKVDGDQRLPLGANESVKGRRLRGGVLVRSLVQDWLLAPEAVVVGPGEYAYLRQLATLYEFLGLRRSPLIPRLGGTLIPARWRGSWEELTTDQVAIATGWAEEFVSQSEENLRVLLQDRMGVEPERSAKLAGDRTRRWRRGLLAMMAGLARENRDCGGLPPWVCPQGKSQERTLAAFNALGIWGSDFLESVAAGAQAHLRAAEQGRWNALAWEVENQGETT